MKNKSVQNCRFVHHAKFHCIMTTLNRGGGKETGKEPNMLVKKSKFFEEKNPPGQKYSVTFGTNGGTKTILPQS